MTATPADTPTRPSGAEQYEPFITAIIKACNQSPGRRAALRRGLGRPPEQAPTMHAMVARWIPVNASPAVEHAYYSVAAMIAAQARQRQPDTEDSDDDQLATAVAEPAPAGDADPNLAEAARASADPRTLGASLALAVIRPGKGRRPLKADTAQKRLHLLVRQGFPGVHRHLPGVVHRIHTVGVTVDWCQLLHDLRRWDSWRDQVTKRWLQDYYRTLDNKEQE
jgi:CRISPR system Cascade subunit CasB